MANFRFDIDIQAQSTGVDKAKQELQQLKTIMTQIERDPASLRIDSDTVDSAKQRIQLLEDSIREAEEEGKDFGDVLERNMRQAQLATQRTTQEVEQLNRALRQIQAASINSSKGLTEISRSAKLATQNIRATTEYMDRLKNNMLEGFGQTVAFGSIMAISTAITEAVQTVQQLDKVMTQVSVVSGKSAEQMEAYRDAAGEAADILGSNAKAFMEATLIYEQQGGMAQTYAQELGRATVIGANIDDTGKDAQEISEYITAIMNGFEMLQEKGGESGLYIMDVLSRLGSVSGSALNEMSEGLQRVSNLARTSGFEFEEISAAIATVSETTRRSASTIGNAFKSILVSFQQIREASDEEQEEFTSKIEKAFKATGMGDISIFDNGELREAKGIMDDIGARWDTMDINQKAQVSEAIAGKYHAEVFQAFMENQERYQQLTAEAFDSEGVAMQQQLIYMDSLQSKVEGLKNAWQSAASAVIDTDWFKGIVAGLTNVLNMIGGLESTIGALGATVLPVAAVFASLFGGRLMAQGVQNKEAKSLADNVLKRLEKEELITQAQREQLKVGKEQQQVSRALGQHAGEIYKQAQQEIRQLQDELKELESLEDRILADQDLAIDSWRDGKQAVKGVNPYDITRVGEEAEARFRQENESDELINSRKEVEKIREVRNEITRLKSEADDAFDGMNDDTQKLGKAKTTLQEMAQQIRANADGNQKMLNLADKLERASNDTNLKMKDYNALAGKAENALKEVNREVTAINQNLEQVIDDQVQINRLAAEEEAIRESIERANREGTRNRDEIQDELNMMQATNDQLEQGAQKAQMWRKSIEVAGGAVMGLVPILASFQAVQNGTLEASEAIKTSIGAISMGLLLMPHPIAKVVGAVGMLATVFLDFRNEQQRLTESNEDLIRSYLSLSETATKNLSTIRSIETEYNKILHSRMGAEEILASGTDEQKESYKQLAEQVAQSSPELVKYYDAEGNAVIDLTKSYQELYNARSEDVRLASELLNTNIAGFAAQYSYELQEQNSTLANSTALLNEYKDKLREAQEIGDMDKVTEYLKETQKLTLDISNALTAGGDTRSAISTNVLQPILDSNESLEKFKQSGQEGIKVANELYALGSDILNKELTVSLLEQGDVEAIQRYETIVDQIFRRVETANANAEEKDGVKIFNTESIEQYQKLLETDPSKFHMGVSMSEGSLTRLNKIIEDDTLTSYELMNRSIKDFNKEAEEHTKKLEEIGDTNGIVTSAINGAGLAAGATAIALGSVATAAAPLTAGISYAGAAIGTTAAALVGAVSGAAMWTSANQEALKATTELNKETVQSNKDLWSMLDAFAEGTKTVEGFNNAMSDIRWLNHQEEAIESVLTGFDNIAVAAGVLKGTVPEVYQTIANEARAAGMSVQEYLPQALESVKFMHNSLIASMMGDNAEYYNHWMQSNSQTIQHIAQNYGIEAQNFTSLNELRSHIMAMDASNFRMFAEDKYLVDLGMNKAILENSRQSTMGIGSYVGQGVNDWAQKFNWFGSESLTVGDKIVFGMLLVVDTITGAFAGLVNVIAQAVGGVILEIDYLIRDTLLKIEPLVKVYDSLAGTDLIGTMNAEIGALEKGLSKPLIQGTNWSETYAQKRASDNEANKANFLSTISYKTIHSDTFADFGQGYNSTFSDVHGYVGKAPANFDPLAEEKEKAAAQAKAKQAKEDAKAEEAAKKKAEEDKKEAEKAAKKAKKDAEKEAKKEAEKKDVEDIKLELDRYYKLENALSVIDDKMKDLSRTKDSAFGGDKIKAMDREQAQYAAQIKVLQAYQTELGKEQAEKKKILANNGFKFDKTGEVTNLNERLTAMQNAANKLTFEAKEKAIENLKKVQEEASRYSEITFSLIPDKKEAIESAKAAVRSLQKEKLEYNIKLTVDKQAAIQEVRDLMKDLSGDDYDQLDEKMLLSKQDIEDSLEMYKFYQNELEKIRKDKNLNEQDRQDMIKQYTSEMYGTLSSAKSAYEEINAAQSEFISQTSELITTSIDAFDKVSSKAAQLADVIKDVYGDQRYQEVARLRDIQIEAIEQEYQSALRAQQEMVRYRNSLKKGTDQWKEANEVVEQLGETVQTAIVDKIEAMQEKFEEFMESLLRVKDAEVFGTLGYEGMVEQFERAREQQDKYLSGFERVTKIGEEISKVNEAIANTASPEQAERYQKFKEKELETLLKSGEVSEAQLERAKLLWEIEQKQEAAEERKNLKRQAQLVRDQNGNMAYEYVTTSEAGEKSGGGSDLASANRNLYEFDVEQAKVAQDKVLEVVKETEEKIQEIYKNTNLSEAQRKAALDVVMAQSKADLAEAQEDMVMWTGLALEDGIKSLKTAIENGSIDIKSIGISQEDAEAIFEAFTRGIVNVEDILSGNVQGLATFLGQSVSDTRSLTSNLTNAIIGEVGSATQQLMNSSNNWSSSFGNTMATLQTQYSSTQANIQRATQQLSSATGNLTSQIQENKVAFNSNLKTIQEQSAMMEGARLTTDKTSNSYQQLTDKLIGKDGKGGTLAAMAKVRDEMNQRLKASLEISKDRTDKLSAAAGSGKTGATTTLNTMATAANNSFNKTKQFDSQTIRTANDNVKNMSNYANTAATNVQALGEKSLSSRSNIASLSTALAALPGLNNNKYHYYTVTQKDGSITSERSKEKRANVGAGTQYVGYFDTGGMYGSWTGSSGNQTPIPAFLHEKELVLNKEDTANFLEGIMAQREMLRQYQGMGMDDVIRAIGMSGATTNNSTSQEVHIHAQFPNATNSSEIEEAFRGLALRANSYASRQ